MSLMLSRAVVRARHSAVALSAPRSAAALPAACSSVCVAARCASATRCGCGCGCGCVAAVSVVSAAAASSSVASRSFHASARSAAPAPSAGATSLSEYDFSFLNVLKEYKDPNDKVVSRPDAAYPSWIYDQTPEPTWGDLLLADFASLPTTYQKRVFSMPRKQEIKRKNDLTRKG